MSSRSSASSSRSSQGVSITRLRRLGRFNSGFIARFARPTFGTQVAWLGGLFALLTLQTMPGLMTIQMANIAEAQSKKPVTPPPAWALNRGTGPKAFKPGHVPASAKLPCSGDDCAVDMRTIDLSKVPTEKRLRRAGQLGGALAPLSPADPDELARQQDKELKAAGLPQGINTAEDNSPIGREVKRRKDKVRRLQKINLSFGAAMNQWNKHNFRGAAKLFQAHIKEFNNTKTGEESPWTGEAELHLGCDAKYNGRFAEAENVFSSLVETTSDDPKDPSFEINQKAKARWADLDLSLGRLDEASQKMQNLLKTDTDWKRRTWASSWLITIDLYKKNVKDLRACGPQALAVVLKDTGRQKASAKMAAIKGAPREAGYSLAEVSQMAAKQGLPMQGFRASSVAQLSALPTPFIVHFDFHRVGKGPLSFAVSTEADRSKIEALPKTQVPLTTKFHIPYHLPLATAKSRQEAKAHNPFHLTARAPGHYLVVRHVDAAKQQITLFDPILRRPYHLSFGDLANEWSGKGLMLAKAPATRKVAAFSNISFPRLASLSVFEMAHTFAGCCGHYSAGPGKGCGGANQGCNGSCGAAPAGGAGNDAWDPNDPEHFSPDGTSPSPMGSPIININRYSLNTYVVDTPMWYKPAKGPPVELKLSYNSQDSLSNSNPFGNKWMFSYGSYITEDTTSGGGNVTIFMPDGNEDVYTPNELGGYTSPVGNTSSLHKLSDTRYELVTQGGDKIIYDIPEGTTSDQPFLVEIQDRFGYSLHIGYNANVKPVTITDALGQVTTLVYDANDHVTSVWDPFGRSVQFQYDVNGNMVQCTDMEGNAFGYVYDYDARLNQVLTAQGTWHIDNAGGYYWTGIQVTDPTGHGDKWGYSGYANYSYTDKQGVTVSYNVGAVIDGKPEITGKSNPDGTSTATNFDWNTARPMSRTDARGNTTSASYNDRGNPATITDAKKNTTTINYASNGQDVTSVVDAQGVTIRTLTYDSHHEPLTVTDGQNQTTTYTYTSWGAPATVTDPQGHVLICSYNTPGHLVSVSRDGQTLDTMTYDAIGRVKTYTDAQNHTLTYEYNNLDKVTRITFDDGTYISYDYVCCGLVGVMRDRAGRFSYYDYDALKRLTRTQDSLGHSLTYSYDARGKRVRLIDANGNTTRWGYDNSGRMIAKAYADGSRESWSYDPAQGVVEHTNSRGEVTSMAYDANNNLSLIDYPEGTPDVKFAYNELNKPIAMQDGLGTTHYAYDDQGRVTSVDGPLANDTVSYSYDNQGRRDGMSVAQGSATGNEATGYGYDALGRLSSITDNNQTWNYSYVGTTKLPHQLTAPNGVSSTYSYDDFDRMTQLANVASGGANVATYNYAYDTQTYKPGKVSLTSQIGTETPQTTAWGYDSTDQLTSETVHLVDENGQAITHSSSHNYDAMGNLTQSTRTTTQGSGQSATTTSIAGNYVNNALNQTTATLTTPSSGTPVEQTLGYDSEGNLMSTNTANGGKLYTYDGVNRLTSVITTTGQGQNLSRTTFAYDGLSRLVVSKRYAWQNGAWVQGDETRRVYDGINVVQERDGSNVVTTFYVRGQDMGGGIGGILSRTTSEGHFFYSYDGRGNVTQLTDSTGASVARYDYDAFGGILNRRGNQSLKNPYRFSTKEDFDGLSYYGFRFYSPSLAKWLNRDPIQERGSVNLYEFVGNSPINYLDRQGFVPIWIQFGAAVFIGAFATLLIGLGLSAQANPGAGSLLGACLIGAAAGAITAAAGYYLTVTECDPFDLAKLALAALQGAITGCLSGMMSLLAGAWLAPGATLTNDALTTAFGTARAQIVSALSGVLPSAVGSGFDAIQAHVDCDRQKADEAEEVGVV